VTDELQRVRACILRYGWNSTCYQLLNPGFQYWFSRVFDAVVGYVEYASVCVVAGAPVCAFEVQEKVVAEFEEWAAAQHLGVCYFASEARLESIISGKPGYSVIRVGAQPVWHPAQLAENMREKSSLRSQVHRAQNKSVMVEEWSAERATDHPALHALLLRWLATRGLPSLHFLVEPETLSHQTDRRIFVARVEGREVGFLNLSPVPQRNGWLAEQFVRDADAPNGTIELLLAHAAEALMREGFAYFTLGLSPLTQHSGPGELSERIPATIRILLDWARAHGRRFYNFEGLEFFKTKFEPQAWESVYAIAKSATIMPGMVSSFSLRSLYAIACAFTKGHPIATVIVGIARALGQEVNWLVGGK